MSLEELTENLNRIDINENEETIKAKKTIKKYLRIKKFKIKLTPSELQTKDWVYDNVSNLLGQGDSKREKFQRLKIEEITNKNCPKCKDLRFNKRTLELKIKKNPYTLNGVPIPEGIDWIEDIDGKQEYNNTIMYFNFKWTTEGGGGQNRTLQCLAAFIEIQLKYSLKNKNGIYFVNILDGDVLSKRKEHFYYIASLPEYKYVKNFVFIGDTYEFIDWFYQLNIQ